MRRTSLFLFLFALSLAGSLGTAAAGVARQSKALLEEAAQAAVLEAEDDQVSAFRSIAAHQVRLSRSLARATLGRARQLISASSSGEEHRDLQLWWLVLDQVELGVVEDARATVRQIQAGTLLRAWASLEVARGYRKLGRRSPIPVLAEALANAGSIPAELRFGAQASLWAELGREYWLAGDRENSARQFGTALAVAREASHSSREFRPDRDVRERDRLLGVAVNDISDVAVVADEGRVSKVSSLAWRLASETADSVSDPYGRWFAHFELASKLGRGGRRSEARKLLLALRLDETACAAEPHPFDRGSRIDRYVGLELAALGYLKDVGQLLSGLPTSTRRILIQNIAGDGRCERFRSQTARFLRDELSLAVTCRSPGEELDLLRLADALAQCGDRRTPVRTVRLVLSGQLPHGEAERFRAIILAAAVLYRSEKGSEAVRLLEPLLPRIAALPLVKGPHSSPDWRVPPDLHPLGFAIRILAQARAFSSARRALSLLPPQVSRDEALADLSQELNRAGRRREAIDLARSIAEHGRRREALCEIAVRSLGRTPHRAWNPMKGVLSY